MKLGFIESPTHAHRPVDPVPHIHTNRRSKGLAVGCSDEHQLALATHNAVSLTSTATHGVGRGTAHLALATHNAVERGGTAGSPFRQLPFSRSPFFRSGALDPPVACSLFSSLTRSHPHPCHPKIPSPPERHQYVAPRRLGMSVHVHVNEEPASAKIHVNSTCRWHAENMQVQVEV